MQLYQHFQQAIHRQEVIASLVEHIGSPIHKEVDSALVAISNISIEEERRISSTHRSIDKSLDRDIVTMKNFLPFLKYILDDLRFFHYISI